VFFGRRPPEIGLLGWSATMLAIRAAATVVLLSACDARSLADGSGDAIEVAPVFLERDDAVRQSLASGAIAEVERGTGGRSVAFKITLDDGTVGYFKPEQTYAAHWYSELAAYHIDRELGLGRVPPAVGRRFEWEPLREVAADDPHLREVIVDDDGTVRGSFVWWVPEELVPLDPPPGWEAWLRIEPPLAASPYQWISHWKRADRAARGDAPTTTRTPPTPTRRERPAELSDLILFDYLIGNQDRWGGGFNNVRTMGPDGPLVFHDNANGFHAGRRQGRHARAQLYALQRVRGSTIEALERLDVESLKARLARDPLAPVLRRRHLTDLEQRRQEILDHVHELRETFGDDATPW
jgi:hypothetical protein